MDYHDYITIDKEIRSGKPHIKGTRITVFDVLDYLAGGMSVDELVKEFPQLSEPAVRACIAYAADRERRTAHQPQ